ncbi:MAG TPA: hypothetical protein VGF21_07440 [Thermoleophilaceae bacterium]
MVPYLLHHRHGPEECGRSFAAWKDVSSPLRHTTALATCRRGGHELWWLVEAEDEERALALLPAYVAERTEAVRVDRVPVP